MRLIDADALIPKGTKVTDAVIAVHNAIKNAPTIEAVPLSEIYRVIAGHSDYRGDNILAALTCIAEGKAVNPVKPLKAEPVRHGRWVEWWPAKHMILTGEEMLFRCSECDAKYADVEGMPSCPWCGAKMDGEQNA